MEESQGDQQKEKHDKLPELSQQELEAVVNADEALLREEDVAYDDESKMIVLQNSALLDKFKQNPSHDPATVQLAEGLLQLLWDHLGHTVRA